MRLLKTKITTEETIDGVSGASASTITRVEILFYKGKEYKRTINMDGVSWDGDNNDDVLMAMYHMQMASLSPKSISSVTPPKLETRISEVELEKAYIQMIRVKKLERIVE